MPSRRQFLSGLGGLKLTGPRDARPNIVVILMDDLRWDELHCTGHPFALTPHSTVSPPKASRFATLSSPPRCARPAAHRSLPANTPTPMGTTDNTDRSPASHRLPTFPRALRAGGYETAFAR